MVERCCCFFLLGSNMLVMTTVIWFKIRYVYRFSKETFHLAIEFVKFSNPLFVPQTIHNTVFWSILKLDFSSHFAYFWKPKFSVDSLDKEYTSTVTVTNIGLKTNPLDHRLGGAPASSRSSHPAHRHIWILITSFEHLFVTNILIIFINM